MNSNEVFIHIHQGCFAGTGAIVRLPQCQWSKPDRYGKISQCITTTKHSKAKTSCIFLGIYCMHTRLAWCSWFIGCGLVITKIKIHYSDVILRAMAFQITNLTVVYSTAYSGADQRKYQSSASLAYVRGPVNSPHKRPVTRNMFPFGDVIMKHLIARLG